MAGHAGGQNPVAGSDRLILPDHTGEEQHANVTSRKRAGTVPRMSSSALPPSFRLLIPSVPVVVAGARQAVILTPDGELETLPLPEAARRLRGERPMVCHLPAMATRLKVPPFAAHDVLELFAFVHPAKFCLPTIGGLAAACGLDAPVSLEDSAQTLVQVVRRLLMDLPQERRWSQGRGRPIAWAMMRGGWLWAPSVLSAWGEQGEMPHSHRIIAGLRIWEHLPEFSEHAPESPPSNHPVDPAEARTRLGQLLGTAAEDRPQQADFASACATAFAPRDVEGEPRMVLAEAGTGVGKTLGYIAPASVWAEKNDGAVWISTYTRNLQRQLDGELDRLHPDPAEKARKVVVRKGRENYLCLLNLEEAVNRLPTTPALGVPLGLMARWALASRDGDMVGGDFPGWLSDLVGRAPTLGLMDRRGECVFAACPHYTRCFIERSVRKARRARIVVANHALVMLVLAHGGTVGGGEEGPQVATRYVFDEGHHLFDAADSAFSAHLTGLETAELRRWLLGSEETGRSRARGLRRRAEELLADNVEALDALDAILNAARCLPGPSWSMRLTEGAPNGPTERFLLLARQQVYARAKDARGPYSLETETANPVAGLLETAAELEHALEQLSGPVKDMVRIINRVLDDEAGETDGQTRLRLDSLARSLDRRALQPLGAWRSMLDSLQQDTPHQFVDWFAVDRIDGRDIDTGMHRHWVDPTKPLAAVIGDSAHGVVVASATLRDGTGNPEADWAVAESRTGAVHLPTPPFRAAMASPFDYPSQTRVIVVNDVRKDDLDQVAAAYRELFIASGGGGLGLFTAISRLRAVRDRIAPPLEDRGIPLYAQHVDGMDTSTLVDIFRAEQDACLLGTDAMRDGVDVPGQSLRLLVFDRVPWPRPDILHRARRDAFNGRAYDDMLTRLRLKQAFGRLVRRSGDHGVFVILDPMMPSRLHGAFPPGVPILRQGVAEAAATVRDFLKDYVQGAEGSDA